MRCSRFQPHAILQTVAQNQVVDVSGLPAV